MLVAPRVVQDSQSSITAISAKFTAAQRLLRNDGFGRVVNAENISDNKFKIFFVHNDRKNARLGIIASKKTLPNAVDRNRVKRIIREAFRQHSIKFCTLDLVVLVRRAYAQECSLRCGNLETLFSRIENRCAEL
jgi:ribonuclease P protein component